MGLVLKMRLLMVESNLKEELDALTWVSTQGSIAFGELAYFKLGCTTYVPVQYCVTIRNG